MIPITNPPPRVAILGGTGFAGRNLRDHLELAGMTVAVFSRTTGVDLLDLSTTWSRLDQFRPDYVVNCAALVGSINYVTDFAADVVDVNTRIVLNAYKAALQLRTVVLINPIANCAYPGVLDHYEETEFWNGAMHPSVEAYGSTRRMMVILSRCYARQYGVRSVNLIVPNMYGPYDSTNPNKTHALNALAIKFVRALKQGLPEIEVWGTGRAVREWLYVRDFAAAVKAVIERKTQSLDPVNLGQNQGYSVTELVSRLQELTGYAGRIVYNTQYGDGAPRKVMGNARFKEHFPEFQFTPLETGLKETLGYYQQIL